MTRGPLRVLLTASGAPGSARLIRALQENGERELAVIGTDMSERSGGRFLCDAFHVVPPGSSDEFAPAVPLWKRSSMRQVRRRTTPFTFQQKHGWILWGLRKLKDSTHSSIFLPSITTQMARGSR